MLRRFFIAALVATPIAGCLPPVDDDKSTPDETVLSTKFIGRWIEVLPGGDGSGFELFKDGTAASIDQLELNYVSWRVEGRMLYLTHTKTVGGTIKTAETGYIATVRDTTRLVLETEGNDWPEVFRKLG